jgi:hypothetical protein
MCGCALRGLCGLVLFAVCNWMSLINQVLDNVRTERRAKFDLSEVECIGGGWAILWNKFPTSLNEYPEVIFHPTVLRFPRDKTLTYFHDDVNVIF